jgi:hypothetical protein
MCMRLVLRSILAPGYIVLLASAVPLFPASAQAQAAITGRVMDTGGAPVTFANVQLRLAADSSLARAAISDTKGGFRIEAGTPGVYRIHVSRIGYQSTASDVLTITEGASIQVPPLILQPEAVVLESVLVETTKPLYRQQSDRLIINVESSPTLAGASALQVLERSPGVVVDKMSGSISLIGKDGVQVMINGKVSYIPADGLVQYLAGISADNVDRIELITSPRAEFDAEGNAGFINIVLKRRPDEGLNGSLAASGGYGAGEVGSGSADVHYQRGQISLSGSYSLLWNGQRQVLSNFRQIMGAEGAVETPSMSHRDPVQRNNVARFAVEYQAGERTAIGALVAGYENKFSMNALTEMSVRSNGNPVTIGRSDIAMFNRWRHAMGGVSLGHQLKSGGKLNVDLDYLRYQNDMPTQNSALLTDVMSGQVVSELLDSDKSTPLRILVTKADYQSWLSQRWELRAGVKGAFSRFTNEVTLLSPVQDAWMHEVGHSGTSSLREDVLAVYGATTYRLGDAASLDFGIRYELTDSELGAHDKESLVDRRFGSFFPSAALQHKLNEMTGVNASYTRRITRPSFNDLASFTRYENRYTLFAGNLALQPAIMSTVKLDLTYRSVLASLQYAWEDSSIVRFQSRVAPGENIQIIYPMNMSDTRIATVLLAVPLTVAHGWRTQNSVSATRHGVEGLRNDAHVSVSRKSFRLTSTHNLALPDDFALEATGAYQSATLLGTARFTPMWSVHVGLQRALPGGKGRLTLSVDDVFDSMGWSFATGASGEPLYTRGDMDAWHRTFRLTYSTRFGDGKAADKRSTASESEGGRVQQ